MSASTARIASSCSCSRALLLPMRFLNGFMTHSLEGGARYRDPCDRTGGGGSDAIGGGSSHAQLSAGQERGFTARGARNADACEISDASRRTLATDPEAAFPQQIATGG